MRPCLLTVVATLAQQEPQQLLAGLAQWAHRRQTRPNQVANSLMRLIGNPYRGQLTGPVQLGQIDRIAPISLNPVARLFWNQRRCHYNAFVTRRGDPTLDTISPS